MYSSDNHTLTFAGGNLDIIDTTSGKDLEAKTSGTLNMVTGSSNTLDTTSGRALR
jgi:hypothetical protein